MSVPAKPAVTLDIVPVDTLDRVFPDRKPEPPVFRGPVSVPRGGKVGFQFAVRSSAAGSCRMKVASIPGAGGAALEGAATLYRLDTVHVEGNTNGAMINRPGGTRPEEWTEFLTRDAPYDVAEVLVVSDTLPLEENVTRAALVDIAVPARTEPGRYGGTLHLEVDGESASASFSFVVHRTQVPAEPALSSTNWLEHSPENLSSGKPPEWWSEAHWTLLANSGRQLRSFGDDMMLTPLIEREHPLIQAIREKDAKYRFDFSKFDRWIETFKALGFRLFAGRHIHKMYQRPGVFVKTEETGKTEPLLENSKDHDAWLDFVPVFYRSLYAHLKKKGWLDLYVQHQYDEPTEEKGYRELAALREQCMPGIRSIDAINQKPELYSSHVDIHVFSLMTLMKAQALAEERRAKGQPVWLYHCTSPYPPWPNRHLDRPLSECRLYPLLCLKYRATGFLFWAANCYRRADEYRTSLGPLPDGSQDPGHPPGDAWMFYRGPDGLRGSMRMLVFRDGLLDHRLLQMLQKKDAARAHAILEGLARSVEDCERNPASYHEARKAMLSALDE